MTNLLIKLFVKDSDKTSLPIVRQRYASLSSVVAVLCNILLFSGKYILGVVTGSIAITADAFNNLSDVGSAVATFIGFRVASQPADDDHPFGHGRIEYVAGLIIAFLILLVGFEIVKTSFDKVLHPKEIEGSVYVILALIFSILVKLWMGFFNKALAERIDSATMRAVSRDSFNDCISTGVTTFCIAISFVITFPIDGFLGMGVGLFIIYSGYKTAKETISPLLGNAPNPDTIKSIEDIILSYDLIYGVHDLIIHDYGPGRTIASVHAEVANNCDIRKAHDVIDNAERRIRNELNIPCTIHFDPIETDDKATNDMRDFVESVIKNVDERFSMHDFRMVPGEDHTNLIFDVVLPHRYKVEDERIKERIDKGINEKYPNYFTIITFERSYV